MKALPDKRTYITPEDVGAAVDAIDGTRDPEVAHAALDDVWELVLRAIADKRAEDPSACAWVAVKALEKVKTRWYA